MVTISHKYRFLFIKTRKTAGSSVERFLLPYLGASDVLVSSDDNGSEVRYPPAVSLGLDVSVFTGLTEHMSATELRNVVGLDAWSRYFKFTIERDPWDRVISLWRWRQKLTGIDMSLDDYLDAIEQRRPTPFLTEKRRHWSNWLLYTEKSVVIVDQVMRYENLADEFQRFCIRFHIPVDGELPVMKAGVRRSDDTAASLTEEQVCRMAALYYREARHFGYAPPQPRAVAV